MERLAEAGLERLVLDDASVFLFHGRQNLVEEDLQRLMRNLRQPQRWLAHLADTLPQCRHVLGTQIRMMRKGCLQLVDRLRGDAGREYLVQPQEGIVVALEPGDARLALLLAANFMVLTAASYALGVVQTVTALMVNLPSTPVV